MEFAILKAALFVLSILDGIYLGVLAHEFGHALVALLVTRQSIGLQVGRSRQPLMINLGRLSIALGLVGFRYGSTTYDRSRETSLTQRWVIAGGPIASFVVTVSLGISLWQFEPWGWVWIGLFGLFVANFRILIVSLWPMEHKAPGENGEIWLSDSLDFWRTGKR